MDNTHNCIDRVRDEIKKESPEIGWIKFDLSTIQNVRLRDGIKKTGQKITYSYQHKKRNGTFIEKTATDFVTHNFCPFCGEKYPESPNN